MYMYYTCIYKYVCLCVCSNTSASARNSEQMHMHPVHLNCRCWGVIASMDWIPGTTCGPS